VSDTTEVKGSRAIARDAVRARISEVAVDLFTAHGFENVTVEQIADVVGISARSFHRYFPSKEDAVIEDAAGYGEFVRAELASRPVDEPVWDSLRQAYEALVTRGGHDDRGKRAMRLLSSTPTLRARNLEKHLDWAARLTPLVADRLTGTNAQLRAQALVHASLACFDVAMTTWAIDGETRSINDLLHVAFSELGSAQRP
jgi:AcrR family transcriptional regulator